MPPDFQTLLEPGERLLWQGRPDASFTIAGSGEWGSIVLGVLVAAIIGTFAIMAARDGQSIPPAVMVVFGTLSVAIAAAGPFYSVFERRNSWYALTSQRAILFFDAGPLGPDLRGYAVRPAEVVDAPAPGHRSVQVAYMSGLQAFDAGRWQAAQRRPPSGIGRRRRDWPVAFERIADADRVVELARAVRDGHG
jgi:hypothetical protein